MATNPFLQPRLHGERSRAALGLTTVLATTGVVALAAPPAFGAVIPCTLGGSGVTTCEYGTVGEAGVFQVPSQVTTLTVTLRGGEGGDGGDGGGGGGELKQGGPGGLLTDVELSVDPGSTLNVYLGAGGQDGTCQSGAPDSEGGAGGRSGGLSAVGGGAGGAGFSNFCGGGGGGGGSFVMLAGQLPGQAQPLLAAGGGGGGGGEGLIAHTGGTGGPGDTNGSGSDGGERGSAGGAGGDFPAKSGTAGSGGKGAGGSGFFGGGGGGGGVTGGGGGGDDGTGGGGGCGLLPGGSCPAGDPDPEEPEGNVQPASIAPHRESGGFRAASATATGAPGGITISYSRRGTSGTFSNPVTPGSNDPNSNTNPGADPKPLPGMDPATTTARCRPSKGICTVTPPPGVDSQFRIDADGGTREAILFATTKGHYTMAGVDKKKPSGRPDCLDYTERNADWVQFGFLEPEDGATWRKTAVMTQRKKLTKAAGQQLAKQLQICFSAPYSFPTREGYRAGTSGKDRTGVLPECRSAHVKTTRAAAFPCVLTREIVKVKNGWTVRITFRVPASAQDPKALG